jgi:HlyD family secretion protein
MITDLNSGGGLRMKAKIKKLSQSFKKKRKLLTGVAASLIVIIATLIFWGKRADASDYITAKAERSSVEVTVSATGTAQAVTTVQVGSQASGAIAWLGADFNSQVKRGQIIARLDPSTFEAQVENARASVVNAEAAVQAATSEIANQSANIQAAKANREATQVQSKDAEALVSRYKELSSVVAGRDIESAQAQASAAAAKVVQASAQVSQAEAARQSSSAKLEQAKAQLAQARAQLEQAQVNLDHTIITSPIDGVVVSRNVDVGQTVAASLQAPTLFTIANDLTKMQILASVDEADMGQVREGIKANFSVDAYAGETFSGKVSQVRLNSQNLQNVVTYTAVIEVSNPDLKLRPGMTASITFPVQQRENVLTVPNAALRFKPNLSEEQQQQLRAEMQARREQRAQGQNKQQRADQQPAQNAGTESNRPQGQTMSQAQTIWVLVGGKKLEPRFARAGLTNGRVTEIVAGNLQEGETVVVGQNDGSSSNSNRAQQPASPFGQQQRGGGRGRMR